MTRDAFLEGFTERLRNVLQKHSRAIGSRQAAYGTKMAEDNLDAAVDELARYLCDAFDMRAAPAIR